MDLAASGEEAIARWGHRNLKRPPLRAGVTELFVESELSPSLFARLCKDNHLFSQLSEAAATSRRGRSYLKRVREFIDTEPDASLVARGELIEDVLR
jgi:hypothetical protein